VAAGEQWRAPDAGRGALGARGAPPLAGGRGAKQAPPARRFRHPSGPICGPDGGRARWATGRPAGRLGGRAKPNWLAGGGGKKKKKNKKKTSEHMLAPFCYLRKLNEKGRAPPASTGPARWLPRPSLPTTGRLLPNAAGGKLANNENLIYSRTPNAKRPTQAGPTRQ